MQSLRHKGLMAHLLGRTAGGGMIGSPAAAATESPQPASSEHEQVSGLLLHICAQLIFCHPPPLVWLREGGQCRVAISRSPQGAAARGKGRQDKADGDESQRRVVCFSKSSLAANIGSRTEPVHVPPRVSFNFELRTFVSP